MHRTPGFCLAVTKHGTFNRNRSDISILQPRSRILFDFHVCTHVLMPSMSFTESMLSQIQFFHVGLLGRSALRCTWVDLIRDRQMTISESVDVSFYWPLVTQPHSLPPSLSQVALSCGLGCRDTRVWAMTRAMSSSITNPGSGF
jgi:hypothetical protein